MRPRRLLSQVFLRDKKYIYKILDILPIEGEEVLEIGAGMGNISEYICSKTGHLYCLEIDKRFSDFLKKKFSSQKKVTVIHTDILKFPLSRLGKKVIIFGNVPYRISSLLIEYLVRYRRYIKKAYLTFQKEFVQKLIACASSKYYSALSCYIQYYAKAEKLFDIPAKSFWPRPGVKSSFVKLEFYSQPPYKVNPVPPAKAGGFRGRGVNVEELLFTIIRKAFSKRRKKITNALSLPGDKYDFFTSLAIDPNKRAEDLSLKEYVSIVNRCQVSTHRLL